MAISATTRRVVPVIQVALASGCIARNLLRADTLEDPAWTHLEMQYCWALNAPATAMAYLQREAMHPLLKNYPASALIDQGVFLLLVWLLWHVVCVELGGQGRSVLSARTGFRRLADCLGIAIGISSFIVVVSSDRAAAQIIYTPYQIEMGSLFFVWALVIVAFYGHDLWRNFTGGRPDAV